MSWQYAIHWHAILLLVLVQAKWLVVEQGKPALIGSSAMRVGGFTAVFI